MAESTRQLKQKSGKNDRVKVTREFLWDYSIDGGAVGALNLKGAHGSTSLLPAGAIITGVVTKCDTALTSGGSATVALGITGSATAIESATAYSDGSYNAANAMDFKDPSSPILVSTVDTAILMTVATAALTAGRFRVFVDIILP